MNAFDVVHLHYPFISGASLTTLAAMAQRAPTVVTYHNDLRAHGLRGIVFEIYQRSIGTGILGLAKRICGVSMEHLTTSPAIRRAVGPSSPKFVEVPNGVDTHAFKPSLAGQNHRRSLGILDDAFTIAFVASLDSAHHFKRLDVLMSAVARMSDETARLLVVGDGDQRAHYECLAGAIGIRDRVHFVGGVTHSQLPPYLLAADCLVLPSDSVESFGLVLIEAMACGLPVVASNLPGVRTIVRHENDGYLVPPGDVDSLASALTLLIGLGPDARKAMGMRGRQKVTRVFDWQPIGAKLEDLYFDVTRRGVSVGVV